MDCTDKTWIDEDGKRVLIAPFFPKLYADEISMKIGERYHLYRHPKGIMALGSTSLETAADSLMNLCYVARNVVGVNYASLEKLGDSALIGSSRCGFKHIWDYDDLVNGAFCRLKKVAGKKIIFPNEVLVERAFEER